MYDDNDLRIKHSKFLDDVLKSAQLAAALEVSGWPKPGNVHRTANFDDASFEQFIAGSIALGPANREAGFRGILAGLGSIRTEDVGVGRLVKRSVMDFKAWHRDGNTHLGISLLFTPLSAGAGYTFAERGEVEPLHLRENVRRVMEATTALDAVEVYEAIKRAETAGLGRLEGVDAPDLTERGADEKILNRGQTLFELMELSSKWDNISREWVSGMEISFEVGYPTLMKEYEETGKINTATVNTFLTILSRFPDTFIARKVGVKVAQDIQKAVESGLVKAKEVSEKAAKIIRIGGLKTVEGEKALLALDRELRMGRELNPGTTADLTASSLLIAVLCGVRP